MLFSSGSSTTELPVAWRSNFLPSRLFNYHWNASFYRKGKVGATSRSQKVKKEAPRVRKFLN